MSRRLLCGTTTTQVLQGCWVALVLHGANWSFREKLLQNGARWISPLAHRAQLRRQCFDCFIWTFDIPHFDAAPAPSIFGAIREFTSPPRKPGIGGGQLVQTIGTGNDRSSHIRIMGAWPYRDAEWRLQRLLNIGLQGRLRGLQSL
jgi:hypothetical protein